MNRSSPKWRHGDQLAKPIKEMILKIKQKPTDNQEPSRSPRPLDQIVRILRTPPNPLYDLTLPTTFLA